MTPHHTAHDLLLLGVTGSIAVLKARMRAVVAYPVVWGERGDGVALAARLERGVDLWGCRVEEC